MPRMLHRVSKRPQAHMHFRELGLIYWRVLKAGSSSVCRMFKHWNGDRQEKPRHNLMSDDGVHGVLEAEPSTVVFGLVRHPLARLVSAFHRPSFLTPFDEFVRRVVKLDDVEVDPHLRSQVARLPTTALMWRLEDLPDSWGRITQLFRDRGWEAPAELTRNNYTNHEPWETFFDDEIRAIAEARYAPDFDRFGYAKR